MNTSQESHPGQGLYQTPPAPAPDQVLHEQ